MCVSRLGRLGNLLSHVGFDPLNRQGEMRTVLDALALDGTGNSFLDSATPIFKVWALYDSVHGATYFEGICGQQIEGA